MIAHYYECDSCDAREPIVYAGMSDEVTGRLPEGWVLEYRSIRPDAVLNGEPFPQRYFSYCPECKRPR